MKNLMLRLFALITLVVTVAFASAVASVSAQTPSRNVIANIPFEFSVGDKSLPAGEYAVGRTNSDGSQLRISNRETNESAIRLTQTVQAIERKEQSVLVFKRYGDRYILSEVWLAGESVGRQMFKSSSEKSMDQDLAKNKAEAETVTIIASIK